MSWKEKVTERLLQQRKFKGGEMGKAAALLGLSETGSRKSI